MAAVAARDARTSPIRPGLPASLKREGTEYAIGHGFQWQQGGVYFGGPAVTAESVMVAVIDLTTQLP